MKFLIDLTLNCSKSYRSSFSIIIYSTLLENQAKIRIKLYLNLLIHHKAKFSNPLF